MNFHSTHYILQDLQSKETLATDKVVNLYILDLSSFSFNYLHTEKPFTLTSQNTINMIVFPLII